MLWQWLEPKTQILPQPYDKWRSSSLEGGTTVTEEDEEVLHIVMLNSQTALGSIGRDSLSPQMPFDVELWEVTWKLSMVVRLTELGAEFSQAGAQQKWSSRWFILWVMLQKWLSNSLYVTTTPLSYPFRGSVSDPDWRMDWPRCPQPWCAMSLVLMAFLPAGQEYSPTYMEHTIGLMQRIVKGRNS